MTVNTRPDPVGEWLTLPDLAEQLGIEPRRARQLIQEREVVGLRRGERNVLSVPARFLVPPHLANPANVVTEERAEPDDVASPPRAVVLASLPGTISVLTDQRFTDEEIIEWLFSYESGIGAAPIDALRAGRKSEVRRVAQGLA